MCVFICTRCVRNKDKDNNNNNIFHSTKAIRISILFWIQTCIKSDVCKVACYHVVIVGNSSENILCII